MSLPKFLDYRYAVWTFSINAFPYCQNQLLTQNQKRLNYGGVVGR